MTSAAANRSSFRPAIAPDAPNGRALVLAGGGMRVAYQAGAVQALFEEGLRFSYACGVSTGSMNLAALLSGHSPEELCRRWRNIDLADILAPRTIRDHLRLRTRGASGNVDALRDRILPQLGIDVAKVGRADGIAASFVFCDVVDAIAVSLRGPELSPELLLAGMNSPTASAPAAPGGRRYSDASPIGQCDLTAIVQAGASELWIVWPNGGPPRFRKGPAGQLVWMNEIAALGALHRQFAQIAEMNAQIEAGDRPFGHDRPIALHLVEPRFPPPSEMSLVAGAVDTSTLVDSGYRDASRYLARRDPKGVALGPATTRMQKRGRGIAFRERMTGRITFGHCDPSAGYDDPAAMPFVLEASIDIGDVGRFVADEGHAGDLTGHLYAPRAGFALPSTAGAFRLFSPGGDPATTHMVYETGFRREGKSYWFAGRKYVRVGAPWRAWRETTTLHVTLHEGDASGPVVAAGILRLTLFDLCALLGTLRATGCRDAGERLQAVARFSAFFARELWRTYVLRRPLQGEPSEART